MEPVISGQPSAPCRAGEKARPRRWDSAAPGLAGVMLLFSLARPTFRGLLVYLRTLIKLQSKAGHSPESPHPLHHRLS